MIKHIVLFKIRPDVPKEKVEEIFGALGGLKGKIPGILAYSWGAYSSNEGRDRGYTHGFVMDFESVAARDAYLPHPEHEVVRKQLAEVRVGGTDGVLAFDFEA